MGKIRHISEAQKNNRTHEDLSKPHRTEKRRKRGRRIFVFLLLIFTVAAIVILSRTVFFFVTEFKVEGNHKYDAQEIIDASGVQTGQNIFSINKDEAIRNIIHIMPYINEVKIYRNLPSTVKIVVIETAVSCIFEVNGEKYYADIGSKILEKCGEKDNDSLPKILGVDNGKPEIGTNYLLDDTNRKKILYDILTALNNNGIKDKIISVNIADEFNIQIQYNQNILVKMGDEKDADLKIEVLEQVLTKISPLEKGEIDLSNPQRVTFESTSQ